MTTEPTEDESTTPELPETPEHPETSEQPEIPEQPVSPEPQQSTVETEVVIRRVPRYPRFIILGAGLGAIVTFILTASFPSDPDVGFGALFGYFLIYGVPIGAVFGALVALLLDRIAARRARSVTAEHTIVEPLPYDDEEPLADEPRADAPVEEPSAQKPASDETVPDK